MITNHALYAYSKVQLDWLETKYRHLPMNHHDWDDLKQTIMIRIFDKKHLIKDGAGFKAYIRMLIKNAFSNHIRDTTKSECRDLNRIAQLNIRFARPLRTLVKQIDSAGGIETICEPDCAAPVDNISQAARESVPGIIDQLPAHQKRVLETYNRLNSWKATAKALHRDYYVVYQTGQKAIAAVRARLESI